MERGQLMKDLLPRQLIAPHGCVAHGSVPPGTAALLHWEKETGALTL